jgi:hypothetical protein
MPDARCQTPDKTGSELATGDFKTHVTGSSSSASYRASTESRRFGVKNQASWDRIVRVLRWGPVCRAVGCCRKVVALLMRPPSSCESFNPQPRKEGSPNHTIPPGTTSPVVTSSPDHQPLRCSVGQGRRPRRPASLRSTPLIRHRHPERWWTQR